MADVDEATTYVLSNEDSRLTGKVTTDRGGLTRFGIAQKYHPNLDPTFYTKPRLAALQQAKQVYAVEYARPVHLQEIAAQIIANKVLDIAVNCYFRRAARFVQTALCNIGKKVNIDMVIGPETVADINSVDPNILMKAIIPLLEAFYRTDAIRVGASQNELTSWLRRAARPGI
jgi:lysozyme family protein